MIALISSFDDFARGGKCPPEMLLRGVLSNRDVLSHVSCEIDARERVSRIETCYATSLCEIASPQKYATQYASTPSAGLKSSPRNAPA